MGSELDIPQYQVRLRDDVEWDELVAFGRGLAAGSRWVLGDLACRVGRRYGEARLEAFAEEIDVGYSVLRDYKAVARAFPAEIVGPQTHSWSVYQALAAQEDRLELVSGEPMTAAQARELAASRRKPAKPRKPRKPSRARAQASSRASGDGAGTRQGASGGQQDARPAGGAAAGAEESPAAWEALRGPYLALPRGQRRAFLDWVPELAGLREQLSDPAWVRRWLAGMPEHDDEEVA